MPNKQKNIPDLQPDIHGTIWNAKVEIDPKAGPGICDLIAEAKALLIALARLEGSRESPPASGDASEAARLYDQSTRLLLDNYSAIAERVIGQTPRTVDEMRAMLIFCLEDKKYRMVDAERVAILIRSLLQSPVLAAAAPSAPAPAESCAANANANANPCAAPLPNGASQQEPGDEKRYRVCADGRPFTEALSFAEANRVVHETLSWRPETNMSIYDIVTAIHYL